MYLAGGVTGIVLKVLVFKRFVIIYCRQYIQYLMHIIHKKRTEIIKKLIISNSTRVRDFSVPQKCRPDEWPTLPPT